MLTGAFALATLSTLSLAAGVTDILRGLEALEQMGSAFDEMSFWTQPTRSMQT